MPRSGAKVVDFFWEVHRAWFEQQYQDANISNSKRRAKKAWKQLAKLRGPEDKSTRLRYQDESNTAAGVRDQYDAIPPARALPGRKAPECTKFCCVVLVAEPEPDIPDPEIPHYVLMAHVRSEEPLGNLDENTEVAGQDGAVWKVGPILPGKANDKVVLWWRWDEENGYTEPIVVLKQQVFRPGPWMKHVVDANVVHARLNEAQDPDQPSFVQMIHSKAYEDKLVTRKWIDLTPYGDGQDIIRTALDTNLPELYIWRIFDVLVNACLVMRDGSTEGAQPGWREVIYRDWKPTNIGFIDPPERVAGQWRNRKHPDDIWPYPVLIDMEDVAEISDEKRNPIDYAGLGTLGFVPPELMVVTDPAARFQVSSKTNVWGLGATIYGFMEKGRAPTVGRPGTGETSQLHNFFEEDALGKLKSRWLWAEAPDEDEPRLCTLVRRCLSFRAEDRPSLEDLRDEIRAMISGIEEIGVDGLDDGDVLGFTKLEKFYPRSDDEDDG
jgi:hypothetical protein